MHAKAVEKITSQEMSPSTLQTGFSARTQLFTEAG
jgi:hypothetical protein